MARLSIFTALALLSFAANSILCRLALRSGDIDAASFTSIRLVAGALVLVLLVCLPARKLLGDLRSGFLLFAYAGAFSFAYLGLSAGTGALILFGSVQTTMLLVSIVKNEKPSQSQWLGLALALGGLITLTFPGLQAPPPFSAGLMIIAGVSWGFYSLRGRGAENAAGATAGNFVYALPFTLLLSSVFATSAKATAPAVALAIASGAVTSGLGYIAWYAALPYLSAVRAAILQLLVPIIAGIAGVLILSETLTLRLALATVLTVSGVVLAVRRSVTSRT